MPWNNKPVAFFSLSQSPPFFQRTKNKQTAMNQCVSNLVLGGRRKGKGGRKAEQKEAADISSKSPLCKHAQGFNLDNPLFFFFTPNCFPQFCRPGVTKSASTRSGFSFRFILAYFHRSCLSSLSIFFFPYGNRCSSAFSILVNAGVLVGWKGKLVSIEESPFFLPTLLTPYCKVQFESLESSCNWEEGG